MAELIQFCSSFSPLNQSTTDELLLLMETKTYPKGTIVHEHGEIATELFFINDGLLKLSLLTANKEFVMRFFWENTFFSIFESLLTKTPSRYNLIALENIT